MTAAGDAWDQRGGTPGSIDDASQLPADAILGYADVSVEKLDGYTTGNQVTMTSIELMMPMLHLSIFLSFHIGRSSCIGASSWSLSRI